MSLFKYVSILFYLMISGCGIDPSNLQRDMSATVPDMGQPPIVMALPFKIEQVSMSDPSWRVTAYCPEGYAIFSGGCACESAAIMSSIPLGSGWYCQCTTGKSAAVAICISPK